MKGDGDGLSVVVLAALRGLRCRRILLEARYVRSVLAVECYAVLVLERPERGLVRPRIGQRARLIAKIRPD